MFGKLRGHQLHVPKGEMLVLFLVYEVGIAKQDKLPRKGWGYTGSPFGAKLETWYKWHRGGQDRCHKRKKGPSAKSGHSLMSL